MEIKDYIEKIIDDNSIEKMNKLSEIFENVMYHLENCDKKLYDKYEMNLYEMANGKVLNQRMAEKIVSNMRPYGMKWSIDEIEKIQDQYNINDIHTIDVFVVLNSAYNDFKDIFNENMDMYIKYVKDFIFDEDAVDGKVFVYFTTIANK